MRKSVGKIGMRDQFTSKIIGGVDWPFYQSRKKEINSYHSKNQN